MAKCNEIISKMMLYDNNDERKGSNADSEQNLLSKHPVLQYNTHNMHCGHYRSRIKIPTKNTLAVKKVAAKN